MCIKRLDLDLHYLSLDSFNAIKPEDNLSKPVS